MESDAGMPDAQLSSTVDDGIIKGFYAIILPPN
jgi:hypothetical protein